MHFSSTDSRRGRFRSSLLSLCLAASCGSAPEPVVPLTPPPIELASGHFAGTVLSGRRPGATPVGALDPATCLGVRVDIQYVDRPPPSELNSLASRARLVVGARGGEPLLPVSELMLGALVGGGAAAAGALRGVGALAADPSRVAHLDSRRGVLPVGATFGVEATSTVPIVSREGETIRRRVAFLVSRDAEDDVSVALVVDDFAPNVIPEEDVEVIDVFKRQIVLLEDAPAVDGEPLVIEFPSRSELSSGRVFVVAIELQSAAVVGGVHERLVASCVEDLEAEVADARAVGAAGEAGEFGRLALAVGLDALEAARTQRPALVFLAGSSAAPLALDLALAADDATVAAWVQSVEIESGAAFEPLPTSADVGWLLERTAFAVLARRLDAGDLSTDLRGLLSQHAGEAGRFPGTITAALARCEERAAFEAALVAENLDFLSTSDPASRVRAFDWLSARGMAPEGYDPLGPRAARRAALAALESPADAGVQEAGR